MLADSVNDLLFASGFLYVAHGPAGIDVLDVGTDGALKPASEVQTEGAAIALAAHDGRLIVAEGVMGVAVYDAREPRTVRHVTTIPTDGYARAVEVAPSSSVSAAAELADLFVANGTGGLIAIRTGEDSGVQGTARLDVEGDVRRVALRGDTVFFSRGSLGVCSVGRSLDRSSMRCADVKDTARDILVSGSRIIVADGGEGIVVFDWSDNADPKPIGRLPVEPGSMNRLLPSGSFLFAAADYAGAVVVPLSADGLPEGLAP